MARVLSLDSALDENELVLVDSSIMGMSDFFQNCGRSGRNGVNLNTRTLRDEKEELRRFLEILNHRNVAIIPEIHDELRDYSACLNRKYASNFPSSGYIKQFGRLLGKDFCRPNYFSSKSSQNERLLSQMIKLSDEIDSRSNSVDLNIQDPRYSQLVDLICFLNSELKIKGGGETHSVTDEKLTAAAYFACLSEGIPSAILSADNHFSGLLNITYMVLTSDYFLPYNEELRRILYEKEPKLLFVRRDFPNQVEEFLVSRLSPTHTMGDYVRGFYERYSLLRPQLAERTAILGSSFSLSTSP